MAPSELEGFLSNFQLGKSVELPYSGFSFYSSVYGRYTHNFNPNLEKTNCSVLIRMHPNKSGKLKGINLSNTRIPDSYPFSKDRDTILQFQDEGEIVFPKGSNSTCVGITKLVPKKKFDNRNVCYVIDLECNDQTMAHENLDYTNKILNKMMFSSVRFQNNKLQTESYIKLVDIIGHWNIN